MAIREASASTVSFSKLVEVDVRSTIETLEKIIKSGADDEYIKLIGEFPDKLDLGLCAGWRMIVRYGSGTIQNILIDRFPDKLDTKTFCEGEGWLMLSVYGSENVKRRLIEEFPEKLEFTGSTRPDKKDKGAGWDNIARYGTDELRMLLIAKHWSKLDRNGRRGWHLLAIKGGEEVRNAVELRRGIVRH